MQQVSTGIAEARKNVEAEYEFFEAEWGARLLALLVRTGKQIFFALFDRQTLTAAYRVSGE